MSLSSGVYFGSHSTVSQDARSVNAARRLAGVDRAVVEDEHDQLLRTIRRQAILRVDLLQKRDEIGTALAPAGAHDQFPRRPIEQAKHRHLGGLAGRWNAQIRTLPRASDG
jgi:hypothetical protein